MASYKGKLHHLPSRTVQWCQSINIFLPMGTAHWQFEPYDRSPRAAECAENAENLAFNKHIKSLQFAFSGGSLGL